MPVETDKPDIATIGEPEALIEEARQLQRRRARRRTVFLVGLVVLVVLGIAAGQLARGGSGVAASRSPAAAAAGSAPMVRHMRLEIVKYVSGLPPQRRVDELWSASSTPVAYRWVVRLPGKPAIELGAGPRHDKVLGAEQIYYLYDRASDTIYNTGATLVPPVSTATTTPARWFRTMLAHGAHIDGTTRFGGHRVYVVTRTAGSLPNGMTSRFYVDKKTFVPLEGIVSDAGGRTVTTTLFWQDLPATDANLELASLTGRHPHARVVAAPERIREQYAEATWRGAIAYVPHSLGN